MQEHAQVGQAARAQAHHEFLRQGLRHQRAHGAGDDAHRDNRHGDRGQDHVPEMRPVRHPFSRAPRARAGRRQPHQLRREDDDQHHAQPVMRHAHADDGNKGRDAVHHGVPVVASHEAQESAHDKSQQRGQTGQPQRVAHGVEHFGGHGTAAGDRRAQVAMQRAPQPARELFDQRPVKAVELHQLALQIRGSVRRQDGHQRIARRQMDQQETEQRDPHHDGQGVHHAPEDVRQHRRHR
ncbi:hypothetical protein D3C87_1452290 [compost metagenome]